MGLFGSSSQIILFDSFIKFITWFHQPFIKRCFRIPFFSSLHSFILLLLQFINFYFICIRSIDFLSLLSAQPIPSGFINIHPLKLNRINQMISSVINLLSSYLLPLTISNIRLHHFINCLPFIFSLYFRLFARVLIFTHSFKNILPV